MSAWSDADRELVADAWHSVNESSDSPTQAEAVLDALTAAGWEPRCDCDGVAHDLPILRSHIRGEPDCRAAIDAGCLPEGGDEGSTDG